MALPCNQRPSFGLRQRRPNHLHELPELVHPAGKEVQMSYRDNLDLVFETDGLKHLTEALAHHDNIIDQLASVIEREKWHKQRQSSVSGVGIIEALEDYVDRRAEQIRQEQMGWPTQAQLINEAIQDWERDR